MVTKNMWTINFLFMTQTLKIYIDMNIDSNFNGAMNFCQFKFNVRVFHDQ